MPAAHVEVYFQPAGKNVEAPRSVGKADAEGRYTVFVTTGDGGEGAYVGDHDVTIIGAEMIPKRPDWQPTVVGGEGDNAPPVVTPPVSTPPEVQIPQDAVPLRFTVPPGGTDEADFAL